MSDVVASLTGACSVVVFAQMKNEGPSSVDLSGASDQQIAEILDGVIRRYMERTGEKDYKKAYDTVLDLLPELRERYGQLINPGKPLAETAKNASARVDAAVRAFTLQHPHVDYERALGLVLDSDPALKASYARGE